MRQAIGGTSRPRGAFRVRRGPRIAAALIAALAALALNAILTPAASAGTGVPCSPTGLELLATDQADYAPGSTVHVTGSGFSVACDVVLAITRPDGVVESADISTDVGGSFAYDYLLPPPPGVIGEYSIDALGIGGAPLASMTFSDGLTDYQQGTAATGTCTSPGNVLASDDVRATCARTSGATGQSAIVSGFGLQAAALGIPASATNIQFNVEVEANRAGSNREVAVSLSSDGGATFTAATNTNNFTQSTDQVRAVPSSPTDCQTFGRTWSYSELSDANFRVRAVPAGGASATDSVNIDRIRVRVCWDSTEIGQAAVAGGVTAVTLPSATLRGAVEVVRRNMNWRATSYQFEGQPEVCVNTPNHDGTGTDDEGFNMTTPAAHGTYDVTFRAYPTDPSGSTCTGAATATFTLTDAVTVGIFGDSFGIARVDNYTVNGWTDGDGGGGNCRVETRTGIIDPNGGLQPRTCTFTRSGISTAGRSDIHLRYNWGSTASQAGTTLTVQWKTTAAPVSAWTTLATHNVSTTTGGSPTNNADHALGATSANTSIDIRFIGSAANPVVDDVLVTGVTNTAPSCNNGTVTTAEDTPAGVTLDCSDAQNDSLTYTITSAPAHGTLSGTAPNLTYTPAPNFNGSDSFQFKANDGKVDSNIATVSITVTALNDAPVAAGDAYATDEDTPLSEAPPGVLGNDADVDGDTLSAKLVSGPAHGTLTLNANGSFSYSPAANYHGGDSFTYRATDPSEAESNVATVTLTIRSVNDAPVAANDAYATDEDTTLTVAAPGVLVNDTDVEGDSLTAVLASSPSHGTLTLNADGSFSYTPNANFNGSDSFTYKANDGTDASNVATVTITVNAVNDAPVLDATKTATLNAINEDDSTNAGTSISALIASAGAGYISDVDAGAQQGIAVTAAATANGSWQYTTDGGANWSALGPVSNTSARLLAANANTKIRFVPNANFNGTVDPAITYRAWDQTSGTNGGSASTATNGGTTAFSTATDTAAITVNAVNDAPVAANDAYATDEDTTLTVAAPGVLVNDTDVEGDSLTAVLASSPSHGTLTLNANGSFTYTPAHNYSGPDPDSFTYKANDGTANSEPATVSITVVDNDADNDDVLDNGDNCVNTPNPDQTDTDHDGKGDVCDTDGFTSTPCKATGTGYISSVRSFNFGIEYFTGATAPTGTLSYLDATKGASKNFRTTKVTGLACWGAAGARRATIVGTGTVNSTQPPVNFEVNLEDNGTGKTDRFKITWSSSPVYTAEGLLTSGDIVITPK
jgi:VCBS repeat-containing protein